MFKILNIFFFLFHSSLILFNLFGWIWKKTRKINLICLSLTAFSWFVLGIWYGFGFCPSTELHWQVRSKLGYHDMPSSYIGFLFESATGVDTGEELVNIFAVVFLLVAFIASVLTNIKDWARKRKT